MGQSGRPRAVRADISASLGREFAKSAYNPRFMFRLTKETTRELIFTNRSALDASVLLPGAPFLPALEFEY
jgi:hypothetical protein